VSERHACRLLGQWRGTQRYEVLYRTDEDALTRAIIELASEYGRYGYRRITVKLREAGWQVGKDRVQRIWRREGPESAAETEATRAVVVERRVVCSTAAEASEPRVELRFRESHDPRWKDVAAVGAAR
jgi:HTH-like domain